MAKRKKPDQLKQGAAARKTAGKRAARAEVAPHHPGLPKKRRLNILKGPFKVPPEFFDPLPEEELDSWES